MCLCTPFSKGEGLHGPADLVWYFLCETWRSAAGSETWGSAAGSATWSGSETWGAGVGSVTAAGSETWSGSETTRLNHGVWLSCDHTFSSVANIGSVRKSDGKWMKQYHGLFCVLNSDGEVLTWKFTRSVAFDDIQQQLSLLNDRFTQAGRIVEEFYIDICCSWRKKLQDIFGPQLKVQLDLFHAVQRISKKIPKRHPYHSECLRTLTVVFRDPTDTGPVRRKSTPSPSVIREGLENFQKRWKGVSYNGRLIFPPAAEIEVRSLLVHVDKGCLSGIAPGRGTNKNERLHRNLNAVLHSSRYGVELAYSLLTTTFYAHNERIASQCDKCMPKPIAACMPVTATCVEHFGLLNPRKDVNVIEDETSSACPKVALDTLDFNTAKEQLNILESKAIYQPACEHGVMFSLLDAHSVLVQAVSSYYISNILQGLSTTSQCNVKNLFFTSIVATIEGCQHKSVHESGESTQEAEQRLQHVLDSWRFRRVVVPGDGNCLFTAVALGIIERSRSGDASFFERLQLERQLKQ